MSKTKITSSAQIKRNIARMNLLSRFAAEDKIVMVIGPMCWGKDRTADKAFKNAKRNYPTSYVGPIKDNVFAFYEVPADAWVDDMGGLHWKDGKVEAVELGYLFNGTVFAKRPVFSR